MSETTRILILGAGAGGLRAALSLDRLLVGHRDYPVVLIDPHDHHSIRSLLPEVAAGARSPESATLSLRRLLVGRKVDHWRATIERIDLQARKVETSIGPAEYRWLVLALEAEAAATAPGSERALTLHSVEEALRVRVAVDESFRQAAWKLEPAERDRLATVAVVGAGYDGVALAAWLARRVRELRVHYRLPSGSGHVVLVESAEKVLPECDRAVSEEVLAALRRKGVEVRLGVGVHAGREGTLRLATGDDLPCGVVVWCDRQTPALVRETGVRVDRTGRVLVDRQMRLAEWPEVFAVGESCTVLGEVVNAAPPPAQLAIRQADVVAHNVFAALSGGVPAEYRSEPADFALSLGPDDAVATVRGVPLTGWRATLLRRYAELRYLDEVAGPSGLVTKLIG